MHRYELRTGPEGAGRRRGGYGLRRDIEVSQACVLSTCLDRSTIPPFGLFGGSDGAPNLMWVRRAGTDDWEPLPARMSNMTLGAGDVVRIDTGIGGGFGDPLEREPGLVAEDVADGYIDATTAEAVYGVALSGGAVDAAATEALRAAMRAAGAPFTSPHPERRPAFTPA